MKVEQLMTPAPATCHPSDNLAQVVERMWDVNCGIIPVVDDSGQVIAMITDRDIAIAAATRGLAPGAIRADEMRRTAVIACRPEADVRTALALMKEHSVRRLAVTSGSGILEGILSLDDIALAAGRRGSASTADVISTMNWIFASPFPVARITAVTVTHAATQESIEACEPADGRRPPRPTLAQAALTA